eukprot:CAMPEP_0117475720 /NCGR_PEP_ID=MMETSP0784-20121206/9940_1 /TAXON_ID=39447 /ORGANISM="" /LENGTH=76 /DNA_ID=CAMNT_0005269975 /DNA_START=203 /DNA_END=433 /DNA_ORIENTATION=+
MSQRERRKEERREEDPESRQGSGIGAGQGHCQARRRRTTDKVRPARNARRCTMGSAIWTKCPLKKAGAQEAVHTGA